MVKQIDDPMQEWYATHTLSPSDRELLFRWGRSMVLPEQGIDVALDYTDWAMGSQQGPPPELFTSIEHYGHARLLIQGWAKAPVLDISEHEYPRWRAGGYRITADDMADQLAGLASAIWAPSSTTLN